MAFTLAVGMAIGSAISLITFFLTINHNKQDPSVNGKYNLEVKSGNKWVAAEVKLSKIKEKKLNVRV